jgi:hypothetical protein
LIAAMFLRVYPQEGQRIPKSFEAFVSAVSDWQGMFIEMDGSFVWSFEMDGNRFQIDGMVYDREGAIEYLELKGNWNPGAWTEIMTALVESPIEPKAWDRLFRIHDVANESWHTPSAILDRFQGGMLSDGD